MLLEKLKGLETLALDTSSKRNEVALLNKQIKQNSKQALGEALSLIKSKAILNAEEDKKLKGTIYEGVNHAYNGINNIVTRYELDSKTTKELNGIAKVLLVTKNIDFSKFVNTLNDFAIFAKHQTLLESKHLESNEAFNERVNDISSLLKFKHDLGEGLINKLIRKSVGAIEVTLEGLEPLSVIALIKELKVKELSLANFNALSNGLQTGLKAYYKSIED